MIILIAETKDIIRTGIRYLLHEMDKSIEVKEVTSPKKLKKTLEQENPHIAFINPNFVFSKKDIEIKTNKNCAFIAIEEIPTPSNLKVLFHEEINFATDKNKFEEIVRKYSSTSSDKKTTINNELSNREIDVVREIALGSTNKEIADKLFLSAHTIITHRKNITKKLGIKTTSGLTIYAIINNLIDLEKNE